MVQFFAVFYISTLAILISVIDVRTMTIPDPLNLGLGLGGLIFASALPPIDFFMSCSGAVLGGIGFWLFRFIYAQFRGIDGLGLGDVKFLAAAGTWTGGDGLPPLLLIASFCGIIFCLGWSTRKVAFPLSKRLPFGPFLCCGLLSIALPQILSGRSIYDIALP